MHVPSYPIFLSLEEQNILIAGFGRVGMRKLAMLLPCRPDHVHIVDPFPPSAEGERLLERARQEHVSCSFSQRNPHDADLDGMNLVFLAGSDHELNAHLASLCRERHILCNCADHPSLGSFHVPAVARTPSLAAALSTERASPALARRWKEELCAFLEPKEAMAQLMGGLRPLILAQNLPSDQNAKLFRALAASGLEEALASNDTGKAGHILVSLLPPSLHERALALVDSTGPGQPKSHNQDA